MAKFRISMELQGLKLEIEGMREDAPMIAQNLTQQFGGLLRPAAHIVEGEVMEHGDGQPGVGTIPSSNGGTPRRRTTRRPRATSTANGDKPNTPLDWVHDAAAWGAPSQEWNTASKAIWLLYVAEKAVNQTELTAGRIAKTFNKHYKQARTIQPSHVARDLGKLKIGKEAQVGENTMVEPPRWFLTDEGRAEAERLIAASKGSTPGSA